MRMRYWIKCWNSIKVDDYGHESLGREDAFYMEPSFFKFLWTLWKAYRKHRYLNIDIMMDGKGG